MRYLTSLIILLTASGLHAGTETVKSSKHGGDRGDDAISALGLNDGMRKVRDYIVLPEKPWASMHLTYQWLKVDPDNPVHEIDWSEDVVVSKTQRFESEKGALQRKMANDIKFQAFKTDANVTKFTQSLVYNMNDDPSVEVYIRVYLYAWLMCDHYGCADVPALPDVVRHLMNEKMPVENKVVAKHVFENLMKMLHGLGLTQDQPYSGTEINQRMWPIIVGVGAIFELFVGCRDCVRFDEIRHFVSVGVPIHFFSTMAMQIHSSPYPQQLADEFIDKLELHDEPTPPRASSPGMMERQSPVVCAAFLVVLTGMGWFFCGPKTKLKPDNRRPPGNDSAAPPNDSDGDKALIGKREFVIAQLKKSDKHLEDLKKALELLDKDGVNLIDRTAVGKSIQSLKEISRNKASHSGPADRGFKDNIPRVLRIIFHEAAQLQVKANEWAAIKANIENIKKGDIQGAQERLKSLIESNEKTLDEHDNNSDQSSNLKAKIRNHRLLKESADFILGAFDDDLSPPPRFEYFVRGSTVKKMIQSLMSASQESPVELSTSVLSGPN